jgi:hypothetical protein
VDGARGMPNLMTKFRAGGPPIFFHGALGAASATFAGHYPWSCLFAYLFVCLSVFMSVCFLSVYRPSVCLSIGSAYLTLFLSVGSVYMSVRLSACLSGNIFRVRLPACCLLAHATLAGRYPPSYSRVCLCACAILLSEANRLCCVANFFVTRRFFTYNTLSANIPEPDTTMGRLGRNAFIGAHTHTHTQTIARARTQLQTCLYSDTPVHSLIRALRLFRSHSQIHTHTHCTHRLLLLPGVRHRVQLPARGQDLQADQREERVLPPSRHRDRRQRRSALLTSLLCLHYTYHHHYFKRLVVASSHIFFE